MKELLELLNEYEGEKEYPTWTLSGANEPLYSSWTSYVSSLLIPSKSYGFIKWLVENDKIDLLQLDNRIALSEFNKVERVLMALSISDTPIEDLISYLK